MRKVGKTQSGYLVELSEEEWKILDQSGLGDSNASKELRAARDFVNIIRWMREIVKEAEAFYSNGEGSKHNTVRGEG
jgi:hypothetical protein